MKFRRVLLTGAAATMLALPMTAAFAQTATPVPTQPPAVEATPTLMVTEAPMGLDYEALLADATTLELGTEATGAISPEASAVGFTFEAEAGQRVSIALNSDDFDTYLVLVDSEGNVLDVDDDGGDSLNSLLTGYMLPTNGTYGVIATSFGGFRGTGTAEGEFALAVITFEVRRIEYTQRIEDELTADQTSIDYRFTGSAGDTISIFMGADTFDTYLFLYGPDGTELAYNDDGGGNLDSLIGPFTLPETGEYVIQANSFSRSATGEFFLTLDQTASVPIAFDETVEVSFEGNTRVYLPFEAEVGDIVNVMVDGDVDTSLALQDTFNYTIVTDEDSGRRFNPEITDYVVNTSGTYTLEISTSTGGGTASVTLERGELPSLNEGSQTLTFGQTTTRVLSLDVEAGTTYTLSFTSGIGSPLSPSIDIRYGEFDGAYFSASNVNGGSVTFNPTTTGSALVTINEYSYLESNTMIITLETADAE